MPRIGKFVVFIGAFAMLASACSKGGGTITINGEKANDHGTKTVSGSTFTLEADNDGPKFYFDPTVLKGTPGQKVTIIVKNVGNTKHNFTIESEKINEDVNTPGTSSAPITVTWPQSGIIEFHCEYHATLGMVGELEASS
jgi:plastocyanin